MTGPSLPEPFFRYPHRQRHVPVRIIIPNLLTTIALCSGLASVHFSLQDQWDMALKAVLVAAFFDLLDGKAARLLKATSPFGTMLDSLSDFLSFGVAPAVLLHEWTLKPEMPNSDTGVFALASMMTFVLCSGLRLARFTAATKYFRAPAPSGGGSESGARSSESATLSRGGNHPGLRAAQGEASGSASPASSGGAPSAAPRNRSYYFTGLPTPAAAAAVLIPPMLDISPKIRIHMDSWEVILFTFVVAFMMIGRQPMYSLKGLHIPRRLVAPLMVLVGLLVVCIAKFPWVTTAAIAAAYLLTAPVSFLSHRRTVRRQAGRAGLAHGPAADAIAPPAEPPARVGRG